MTLPRTFSITGSKESNNKPSEKVDYTIVSGTFENMKCEDWYPKIVLDNSGFNSKVCKDIQALKVLDSEKKKIVVQYDPSKNDDDNGKDDGKLGPGPIVGIVIGVIVAVAVIIVVVIIVIKRKKNSVNSSDNELAGNNDDV